MKTLLLLFVLLTNACTSLKNSQVQKRYTQFGISLPLLHWQRKAFKGTDFFFEHESGQATIFINAECDKFSDTPLTALTSQLLVDLSDIKYIKQERLELASREALISELTLKVDGVKRYLKIMVMRKNRCVYDAVFNAAPDSASLATDFDHLLKTFWAEAEL